MDKEETAVELDPKARQECAEARSEELRVDFNKAVSELIPPDMGADHHVTATKVMQTAMVRGMVLATEYDRDAIMMFVIDHTLNMMFDTRNRENKQD